MVISAMPTIKLTYEDYCQTPDDDRYELLDGEVVMVPAPSLGHQRFGTRLGALLHMFVQERGVGEVFHAPCDVVLSDTDVVQPDLLFVANARAHILFSGDNVQGAPDLVVEILSPSTAKRDQTFKRALYARYGVPEYWLVDPDARTITILLLDAGVFDVAARYGPGQTLTSPTLPGFTANLDQLF